MNVRLAVLFILVPAPFRVARPGRSGRGQARQAAWLSGRKQRELVLRRIGARRIVHASGGNQGDLSRQAECAAAVLETNAALRTAQEPDIRWNANDARGLTVDNDLARQRIMGLIVVPEPFRPKHATSYLGYG